MATNGVSYDGPRAPLSREASRAPASPNSSRPVPVPEAVVLPVAGTPATPLIAANSAPDPRPASVNGSNGQGQTTSGAAPAAPVKVRRTVRVSDFDRVKKQVDLVVSEAAKTAAHVEAIEQELERSRRVRLGLDVLHAVARQEHYPCGRALQRVLGQRLLERLKATPARPSIRGYNAQGRSVQEQVAVTFDVPFTRTGLDELVSMQGLSYTPREGRRLARPVRIVHFPGAVSLLRSVDLLGTVDRQQLMCRRFTRVDQSKPARPLIERFADEDGSLFYILRRDTASGQVVVAVRESETYDVRRQAFRHPLVQKSLPMSSLPGLSEGCPCFLSWRESISSSAMEWEGADACGTVSLSLPCCTFEQLPADVAALVSSLV